MSYKTMVGSLDSYDKGSIELNDDLKHYAFSNIFEICSHAKPFERIMVASNLEYDREHLQEVYRDRERRDQRLEKLISSR